MAQSTITPQFSNEFLGQYAVGMLTGLLPADGAASISICHIRNATASRILAVQHVSVSLASVTGFTQGSFTFGLIMGRGVTAASGSGTAVDMSPLNELDADYPATISDGIFRIASTAAMTAGAGQTLDNRPLTAMYVNCPTTAAAVLLDKAVLFESDGERRMPIMVRNGEVLHVITTAPATGTYTCYVNVVWSEVTMTGRTGTVGA